MNSLDDNIKRAMGGSKVKFSPKQNVKTATADGKKIYYYVNKGPSPKTLNKIYKKIPDNKKIPIVIQTKKQYLDEYITNQEKARGSKFTSQEKKQYTNEELKRMKGVVSRYTTKSNKYIDPRIVFFADRKWTPKELKFSAEHEYAHELLEKKPKLLDKYSQNYTPDRAVTPYGATDPEEDYADRYAIRHVKDLNIYGNVLFGGGGRDKSKNSLFIEQPWRKEYTKRVVWKPNKYGRTERIIEKVPYEEGTVPRKIKYKDPFGRTIVLDTKPQPLNDMRDEAIDTYSYFLDETSPQLYKGKIHLADRRPYLVEQRRHLIGQAKFRPISVPQTLQAKYDFLREMEKDDSPLSDSDRDFLKKYKPVYYKAELTPLEQRWKQRDMERRGTTFGIDKNAEGTKVMTRTLPQYEVKDVERFLEEAKNQEEKLKKIDQGTMAQLITAGEYVEEQNARGERHIPGVRAFMPPFGIHDVEEANRVVVHEIGHEKGPVELPEKVLDKLNVTGPKTAYGAFEEKTSTFGSPTEYGKTHTHEDFAETFGLYMRGKNLGSAKESAVLRKDIMASMYKDIKQGKTAREIYEEQHSPEAYIKEGLKPHRATAQKQEKEIEEFETVVSTSPQEPSIEKEQTEESKNLSVKGKLIDKYLTQYEDKYLRGPMPAGIDPTMSRSEDINQLSRPTLGTSPTLFGKEVFRKILPPAIEGRQMLKNIFTYGPQSMGEEFQRERHITAIGKRQAEALKYDVNPVLKEQNISEIKQLLKQAHEKEEKKEKEEIENYYMGIGSDEEKKDMVMATEAEKVAIKAKLEKYEREIALAKKQENWSALERFVNKKKEYEETLIDLGIHPNQPQEIEKPLTEYEEKVITLRGGTKEAVFEALRKFNPMEKDTGITKGQLRNHIGNISEVSFDKALRDLQDDGIILKSNVKGLARGDKQIISWNTSGGKVVATTGYTPKEAQEVASQTGLPRRFRASKTGGFKELKPRVILTAIPTTTEAEAGRVEKTFENVIANKPKVGRPILEVSSEEERAKREKSRLYYQQQKDRYKQYQQKGKQVAKEKTSSPVVVVPVVIPEVPQEKEPKIQKRKYRTQYEKKVEERKEPKSNTIEVEELIERVERRKGKKVEKDSMGQPKLNRHRRKLFALSNAIADAEFHRNKELTEALKQKRNKVLINRARNLGMTSRVHEKGKIPESRPYFVKPSAKKERQDIMKILWYEGAIKHAKEAGFADTANDLEIQENLYVNDLIKSGKYTIDDIKNFMTDESNRDYLLRRAHQMHRKKEKQKQKESYKEIINPETTMTVEVDDILKKTTEYEKRLNKSPIVEIDELLGNLKEPIEKEGKKEKRDYIPIDISSKNYSYDDYVKKVQEKYGRLPVAGAKPYDWEIYKKEHESKYGTIYDAIAKEKKKKRRTHYDEELDKRNLPMIIEPRDIVPIKPKEKKNRIMPDEEEKDLIIMNKQNYYGDPFNPYSSHDTPYTNQFGINYVIEQRRIKNRKTLVPWEQESTS